MVDTFEIDTSLDWKLFKLEKDLKFPLTFYYSSVNNAYRFIINLHVSDRDTFPILHVQNVSDNATVFRRMVKGGLQYDIEDEISIFFYEFFFNPYNLLFIDDIGTKISMYIAVR
jgi:hypothetical protein